MAGRADGGEALGPASSDRSSASIDIDGRVAGPCRFVTAADPCALACVCACVRACVGGWVRACMGAWVHGWVGGWVRACVLQ